MSTEHQVRDLVKPHLRKMRQTGSTNVMAVCPFHRKHDGTEERTPSFTMSMVTGLFYCFSCHTSGTLETFLTNVGVPGSVITKIYGDLIQEIRNKLPPQRSPLHTNFCGEGGVIPEGLLGVLDLCPLDLVHDGFSEETLQFFDVGFDTKHMRITYPLRSLTGDLIGISGRTVEAQGFPRYKVYDEKEYTAWGVEPVRTDKDVVVWNAHKVLPQLMREWHPTWYLVEGFKACMWLHQHGIRNVLALAGSGMSYVQEQILSRIGGTAILCLDNDDAGKKGTEQIGRRLGRSASIQVVRYEGKQPTDVPSEDLRDALSNTIDFTSHVIEQLGN